LKERKKKSALSAALRQFRAAATESTEMRRVGEGEGEAVLTWIWKYTATELQNARLAAASIASAAASIAAIAAAASPPLAPRRGAGRSF
jgi:hypothetical protein